MRPFFVYVIHCGDGSFYVGHTDDLERRWAEHLAGAFPSCHTFARRPLALVYAAETDTRDEAFARERQIKGWTRAKKMALIRGTLGSLDHHDRPRSAASTPPRVRRMSVLRSA